MFPGIVYRAEIMYIANPDALIDELRDLRAIVSEVPALRMIDHLIDMVLAHTERAYAQFWVDEFALEQARDSEDMKRYARERVRYQLSREVADKLVEGRTVTTEHRNYNWDDLDREPKK